MALRKLKPTNPASRFQSVSTFEELTRKKPQKGLTEGSASSPSSRRFPAAIERKNPPSPPLKAPRPRLGRAVGERSIPSGSGTVTGGRS